jgi:MarR-like DNA-binding transcriptional regulator SgrR of sgrS sRNA
MGAQLKSQRPRVRAHAGLLTLGVALAWCDSAAAETRPAYGGAAIGSLLSEPITADPVKARSHAETTLVSLVFDTLYRFDGAGAVVPHLAAAMPDTSEDRFEVRIRLRDGVQFHDGTTLDVNDVVRSLRRAAESDARWLLAPVRSIKSGGGDVILLLRRRTPEIAELLAAPATAITKGGRAPRVGKPIGTGPFMLESFSRKRRRVVLRAADGHFGGRPYLSSLELRWHESADDEPRLYERGDVHMSLRGAVAFSGHQPKYATDEVEGPATVLVYLGFGTARASITGNSDFRRALSLAIARNGFRSVGTGERVVPTLHPAALDIGGAATERAQRHARSKAARAVLRRAAEKVALLREALAGKNNLSFEVLIDRTRPDDREVAEKAVAALYRLGLAARITALGAREFDTRVRSGSCDLYVGQLATPVASAALATAAAFAAGRDDWAERTMVRARLVAATARREFQRRLPIVPLFHRALRIHHRRDVRGLSFDAMARPSFADIFVHGHAGLGKGERPRSGGH